MTERIKLDKELLDEITNVPFLDTIFMMKLKSQILQDHEIVNRLREHIIDLEKEKEYHEKHNPKASVNHQITWLEIAKKIMEIKN